MITSLDPRRLFRWTLVEEVRELDRLRRLKIGIGMKGKRRWTSEPSRSRSRFSSTCSSRWQPPDRATVTSHGDFGIRASTTSPASTPILHHLVNPMRGREPAPKEENVFFGRVGVARLMLELHQDHNAGTHYGAS